MNEELFKSKLNDLANALTVIADEQVDVTTRLANEVTGQDGLTMEQIMEKTNQAYYHQGVTKGMLNVVSLLTRFVQDNL